MAKSVPAAIVWATLLWFGGFVLANGGLAAAPFALLYGVPYGLPTMLILVFSTIVARRFGGGATGNIAVFVVLIVILSTIALFGLYSAAANPSKQGTLVPGILKLLFLPSLFAAVGFLPALVRPST